MSTFVTPTGEIFAADDEHLRDRIQRLTHAIVMGATEPALTMILELRNETQSIAYLQLVCQDAFDLALAHLITVPHPSETVMPMRTLSAAVFSLRTIAISGIEDAGQTTPE